MSTNYNIEATATIRMANTAKLTQLLEELARVEQVIEALGNALTYAAERIPNQWECCCNGLKCRLPQCMSCQADPEDVDWSIIGRALAQWQAHMNRKSVGTMGPHERGVTGGN